MNSQNQMIIDHLKAGQSITSLEALEKFGCFRLASRVNDLIKMGHHIVKDTIKNNNKRYARYYLFCK